MDSLTQIVLGSAISEWAIGKKVGNKAILWGAICGTIPDLDVFLNPFISDLQELGSHRGFSHSIVFSFMMAPIMGYLLYLAYEKKEANWLEWTWCCFLALVTHPLLDCFTNYGTQLFLPFSNYRVAINSIFVVDPGYTLPMLFALLIILFIKRQKPSRSIINKVALMISHSYLLFTLCNKIYMDYTFERAMEKKSIHSQRYMTNPMPLQNLLWNCIAEDANGFYVGYYSLLDKTKDVDFQFVPKNDKRITTIKKTYAIKRLLWFSNGYLAFTEKDGAWYANDLRFGTTNTTNFAAGEYIFKWRIIQKNDVVDIKAEPATFRWEKESFEKLKRRIKGIKD